MEMCGSLQLFVFLVFSLWLVFSACLFCLILICLFLFYTIVLLDAHLLSNERKKGRVQIWMDGEVRRIWERQQ